MKSRKMGTAAVATRRQRTETSHGRRRRLRLEPLESRIVPAVFTVSLATDTGTAGELRWAVTQANTTTGPDTINFASTVNNISLQLGQLNIRDSVSIDGSLTPPVAIRAAPGARIFNVDDGNPTVDQSVQMSFLELRDANTPLADGGAILNREELTVFQSDLVNNFANGGGAIANLNQLFISDSRISGNRAVLRGGGILNDLGATTVLNGASVELNYTLPSFYARYGGGVYNGNGSALIVTGNSLFYSNNAPLGGGIMNRGGSQAIITDSNFDQNSASNGGAVWTDGGSSTLEIVSSRLTGNAAGIGGGVYSTGDAVVTIRDTEIANGFGSFRGGGVAGVGNGTWSIADSQIEYNLTAFAGNTRGAGLYFNNGGSVTITSSKIERNGRVTGGLSTFEGGAFALGSNVTLVLEDTLVDDNAAVRGGAMFTLSPNFVEIRRSAITGNTGLQFGGAFYLGGGNFSMEDSLVSQNDTLNSGGGFYLAGIPNYANYTSIYRSTVANNYAGRYGGGIWGGRATKLGVIDTVIQNNSARERGGGLFLTENSPLPHNTLILSSVVSGNNVMNQLGSTYSPRGGGLWAESGASVRVDKTTISNNLAEFRGGGIGLRNADLFTVTNTTISGNQAQHGGAASIYGSPATFRKTTISGNSAQENGGGFYVHSPTALRVQLDQTTITRNRAAAGLTSGTGGGLHVAYLGVNQASVLLDNTIVSDNGNAITNVADEVFDPGTPAGVSFVAARYSLIRDNTGSSLAAGNPDPNGNRIGTAANPISARLLPLANNGGPTLTHLPSAASPAIDTGDPAIGGIGIYDQRLLPFRRVWNNRADIGSVEVQPPPPDADFNNDGVANCADVDALVAQIVLGTNAPAFDLNGDTLVNQQDLDLWLIGAPAINGLSIKRYLPGDANLDTVVDASDFNIWNTNKFTVAAGWCNADFNADGLVNVSDFNIWNTNKFTASPSCAPPVPGSSDIGADRLVVFRPETTPRFSAQEFVPRWKLVAATDYLMALPRATRADGSVWGGDLELTDLTWTPWQ